MTGQLSRVDAAKAANPSGDDLDAKRQPLMTRPATDSIDTSGGVWLIEAATRINWANMPLAQGPVLHAVREHMRNLVRTRSPDYAYAQFQNLRRLFVTGKSTGLDINRVETYDEAFFAKIRRALTDSPKRQSAHRGQKPDDEHCGDASNKHENAPKAFTQGTVANTLDAYRRWFVFCADEEYEGFHQELATVLENQVIGGNPKGEAVLSNDPNKGPLQSVEVFALQGQILSELRSATDSIDDLLVVWTCLSFGAYPKAMQYLNEEDLIRTDLPDGGVKYELRIPRLKKRGVSPRQEFHVRPVDPRIGRLFERKIAKNKDVWKFAFFLLEGRDIKRPMERPMFPAEIPDCSLLGTQFEVHAMRSRKEWFGTQLECFIERAGMVARDGSPLRLTPRRLRYTFATRLVAEGASPVELAQALDHTDLQHVLVYFNNRSDMVVSLDKVYALRLAPYAQLLTGMLIKNETDALRGNDPASRVHFADPSEMKKKLHTVGSCGSFGFCGLFAHIACYTCFKFQPWLEGPHEKVLDALLREREELLKRGVDLKIVVANDLPILAVALVVLRCRELRQAEKEVGS